MPDRIIRTIPAEGENEVISESLITASDVTIGADELQLLFSDLNGTASFKLDNTLKPRLEEYLKYRREMESVITEVADQQFARYCEKNDINIDKSREVKTYYNGIEVSEGEWFWSKTSNDYCYVQPSVFKLILAIARHPLATYAFWNNPKAFINVRLWMYDQGGHIEINYENNIILLTSSSSDD